jgi:hypothetical protein
LEAGNMKANIRAKLKAENSEVKGNFGGLEAKRSEFGGDEFLGR